MEELLSGEMTTFIRKWEPSVQNARLLSQEGDVALLRPIVTVKADAVISKMNDLTSVLQDPQELIDLEIPLPQDPEALLLLVGQDILDEFAVAHLLNPDDGLTTAGLEKLVKFSRKQNQGMTPVHFACFYGHSSVLQMLLELDDSLMQEVLQLQDLFGNTPLHWACDQGRENVIQTLMEVLPAMIMVLAEIKNIYGRTPKDVANLKGHDTCALLMDM